LLAAAVASVHPTLLLSQNGPTTQPAAPASTVPATGLAQPATTQVSATAPSATQVSTIVPATTQASTTQVATTAPATQVAETQPALDHPPGMIRLNFRDTPLDTILERLSQDAGFSVIKDVPIDVRVSVMSLQPLTPGQAVTPLNAVLGGNG